VTARLLSRSGVVASRREEPAPPRRREPERNPRAARGGVSSALERGWKEEHFTDSTPSSLIMAIIASTPENDAAVLATLPYLLLTIAFTFLAVVRKSVSLSLMEGLTCYILPETDEERWRARIAKATHEKKSSESKRRAKGARAPPAGNIDELGENSIAAIAMTKNQLILKPFWSHVDRLVFFACLVIVHCVAREVHAFVVASDGGAGSDAEGTTTTTTTNVLLAPLAAFSAVSAMRALVRAAIDPASTPAVERHVAVAAGLIGFAFSLVFLLSSPAFARAFEVAETARLTAGATLAETRAFGMEIVTLAEMQVCVALSALAGFINAALFAPAVRVARCYKARFPYYAGPI
jgi:hypothetical protein